ncbi:calcium and integrin-binding protein 1 [Anoplophora glabripennis]|uniref:calcium and integrin-binding protein 1 n=1 Tax=Anoplophora glabripennis TaxID=217634 RepID=UPI0008754A03|nr:calcium and integrin-binding protein 1 [Anoplophora glabripennis]
MGSSNSSLSVLTEDILEEYTILTYLSKAEILNLYKIFSALDEKGVLQNLHYRFPCYVVEHIFPQLKFNPLKDRIFNVFSSHKDGKLSFEDMLDLCSVMSDKCPEKVKAAWAFRIYDFDDDDAVGEDDLIEVINRLTGSAGQIDIEHQKRIIKILLEEMDLASNGSVGQLEFVHAVGKMSEFPHSFCFHV